MTSRVQNQWTVVVIYNIYNTSSQMVPVPCNAIRQVIVALQAKGEGCTHGLGAHCRRVLEAEQETQGGYCCSRVKEEQESAEKALLKSSGPEGPAGQGWNWE